MFLVRTFFVDFDAFLADRLLPDPLAFARRFLPPLAGLLLVSIVLVRSTGVTLVWGSLYGSMVSLGLVAENVENVAQ